MISERLMLFNASSLWRSQYSYGPKKFQFAQSRCDLVSAGHFASFGAAAKNQFEFFELVSNRGQLRWAQTVDEQRAIKMIGFVLHDARQEAADFLGELVAGQVIGLNLDRFAARDRRVHAGNAEATLFVLLLALGCVSAAGINIDGYAEIGGVVHVLSPDLRATHDCLIQAGFKIVQETQVVLVPVADEPGAAAAVFQRLAESHINIKYTYLATRNRLVIAADDPQAVLTALQAPAAA